MTSKINATTAGVGGIIQTADPSGILELQGNGNTGVSISAAGVPTIFTPTVSGVMTGIGSNSFTMFLGAQVSLNNGSAVFDILNTGSIGAAGQTWEITFICALGNSATAVFVEAGIWNGSAYIANCGGYTTGTQGVIITLQKVVTLSAATTFTGRAFSGNTSSYVASTQNCTLLSNTSTSITAVRLA